VPTGDSGQLSTVDAGLSTLDYVAKHTFTNTGTVTATIVEIFGKAAPAK
jgi:hypothetical protein